ncbi:hypothetical protein J1614_005296 [Plenodomus biglobosus]|nr:hypothetical protein J1614_005296 [Plenodomus biglobosus]
MSAQLSTATVIQTATITSGPEINNRQFQGWYIHSDDESLEAINCPDSQSLILTSNYAQCCNIGESTCSVFWTTCAGVRPVGITTDDCGGDFFCQTVSIFDQFPTNNAPVHSQIICGPPAWAASSIYRNVISTSLKTSLSIATPAASPSQQLASSTDFSAQSNPESSGASTSTTSPASASNADPSPSKAWIAGAVAGPILGIAIVALIIWLLLRSKRKRLQKSGTTPVAMPPGDAYNQNSHKDVWAHSNHEAYGAYNSQQKVHEMHGDQLNRDPLELPGHEHTFRS